MTDLQLAFRNYLKKEDSVILFDEPLSKYCSFHIGGNAEILFTPKNEKALIKALEFTKNNSVPCHILGNGSNVLIADEGLSGVVIRLASGLTDIIYLGDGVIACSAGVSLTRLCTFALEKELTGLEFAYGIPGTTGGAIYMNAGAYGGEMKDVLFSVRSMEKDGSDLREDEICNMTYEYRNTEYMKNGRIISAGYFRLKKGDRKEISDKMSLLMSKRKASQPLEYPSAGSAFKRPSEGYAGAHIEQCGLKGLSVGGAQVSTKHAGFIINTGNATFSDVFTLLQKVKAEVLRQHKVELFPEVEILKD